MDNEDYELTQNDIDEIYEFATNASMGIIFHEIGHLIVDEFNVPIFNNEEDVADSFMAWSLIQIPDDLVKGAAAWALGQIGGHSNKHSNSLAQE